MKKQSVLAVCLGFLLGGAVFGGTLPADQRLTDNGDGTVTDNETGRVWLRDADCLGSRSWDEAMEVVAELESGDCGLIDGSRAGDWRLPDAAELSSLADAAGVPEESHAAHSQGGPLTGAQRGFYWSATSLPFSARYACWVHLPDGEVGNGYKKYGVSIWPVRAPRY